MTDTKNYLIQFLATIQGDKMVVKGLQSMDKETQKLDESVGTVTKTTGRWDKSMLNVAKRALMVAPMWIALRAAFTTVIGTVGDMIRANIDLQEQMARIRTAVAANSDSIDSDMTKIKDTILSMGMKTRIPLKDLADGFYFLRSAGLSTEESIAGFEPVVNLAVGTMSEMGETARIVAGIYNTMGQYIEKDGTLTEKFTKIVDVLAYTYAAQEVQLSELLKGYEKLAPYVSGLGDSFTDLVTMLGFLNTHLLKSGRAGTLTAQSIVQLQKNVNKLATSYGITFDTSKPLNFLEVIGQINQVMQREGKISGEQMQILQEIFQTRGIVPTSLMLESWTKLTQNIKQARTESVGFAQKMREIREYTVAAQMQRFRNNLAILANEFFSAAAGTGDFVDVLKNMNDSLESSRENTRKTGMVIGWLTSELTKFIETANNMPKKSGVGEDFLTSLMTGIPFIAEQMKGLKWGLGKVFELPSFKEFEKNQLEARNGAEKTKEALSKLPGFEKELNTYTQENIKLRSQLVDTYLKSQVDMLKAAGGSEKDILELQLKQLAIRKNMMTDQKFQLEKYQISTKLQTAQVDVAQQMIDHQLELLRIRGASELEILKAKQALESSVLGQQAEGRELQTKLELEKEITRQRLLQVGYSSDSIKLYQIAKKYGIDTAMKVADALKEGTTLEEMEFGFPTNVYKQYFPEKYQTLEMRKYFEENPELEQKLPETVTKSTIQQIKMDIPKVASIPPIPVKVDATVTVKTDPAQIYQMATKAFRDFVNSAEGKKKVEEIALDAEE